MVVPGPAGGGLRLTMTVGRAYELRDSSRPVDENRSLASTPFAERTGRRLILRNGPPLPYLSVLIPDLQVAYQVVPRDQQDA
jgi:hypothetical protein